jgi:DNA-binding MarR family transcriptional regulator
METLIPSAHFLRVSDKFFAEYICYDPAVSSHARFLYVLLSRHSARGICGLPQQLLARLCDLSVRSIQHHLKRLSALQYINIEQQSDGRNAYRQLLSPRARHYIALAEADLATWADSAESASAHAKNLRIGGEKSAPSIRRRKEDNTPLSPSRAHPCKTASSCRPFLAARVTSARRVGRGIFSHPKGN